ncbi:MAG: Crp/Fnr family transcriptional regulator [Pyrinomonadaceae bacterium]
MSAQPNPHSENRLLARLPSEDYARLLPQMELVELQHGRVLTEAGARMEYAYFPLHAMISLISHTAAGESVEVGVVGFEGLVNISLILGVDNSPHEALVQFPDSAMRIKQEILRAEFKRGGALHDHLLRFTQGLLLQTSQVAACNRLHSVAERLARWLLMSQDRCLCEELPFTHEFLALMLGVRRAGVTEAAIILQAEGFINYRRGHINIIDRAGLEAFSCACYDVIKTEFNLLVN